MSGRSFESLGFDPAPGDLDLLDVALRDLRDTVKALGEVDGVLSSDRDGEWTGKAAEAFRDMVGEELAPRVTKALQSFDDASRALVDWTTQLEDFQRRADRLEERARTARENVSSAQSAVDGAPEVDDKAPDADDARDVLTRLNGNLTSASSELEAVMSDGRALAREVEEAAGVTAGRIDDSAGSAPDEPGMFEKLGNAIKDMAKWVLETFDGLIKLLEAILPYLVFALAVIALFVPGLNVLIMTLALTMIAIDVLQAVAGEGSWGDVALGVGMMVLGAGMGHLAKGFMAAQGNAFRITMNSPGVVNAMGGVIPGTATAVIRFSPTVFNMASMGASISKVAEAYTDAPPSMTPTWPSWPPGRRR